jgi:hypothetical protein
MARVPITVMGYRCERCEHEWIPRGENDEPRTCPACKSPYWNRPRKTATATTYDDFRERVARVLSDSAESLTWTEVRTKAKLPQALPNNKWVRRLEQEIGLQRVRRDGVIHWLLSPREKSIAATDGAKAS